MFALTSLSFDLNVQKGKEANFSYSAANFSYVNLVASSILASSFGQVKSGIPALILNSCRYHILTAFYNISIIIFFICQHKRG